MKRQQLYRQLAAGLRLLGPVHRFDFRQLSRVGVVDAGAVLDALVVALPVDGQRVDDPEVVLQQRRQRQHVRVVFHAHGLGVTAVLAYRLVGGGLVRAVGIAHLGVQHAPELVEIFLQAPEAAARQIDRPGVHRLSSLRFPYYYIT